MKKIDLKDRTKNYARRIISLYRNLPKTQEAGLIGKQLFRSGTSVGANYRAACRARSRADFVSKMGIVLEEADESLYWMELLVEGDIMRAEMLEPLMLETKELIAIVVSSINTAKQNKRT